MSNHNPSPFYIMAYLLETARLESQAGVTDAQRDYCARHASIEAATVLETPPAKRESHCFPHDLDKR